MSEKEDPSPDVKIAEEMDQLYWLSITFTQKLLPKEQY